MAHGRPWPPRSFARLCAAALAGALLAGCGAPQRSPRNAVLISLDALRADRLGVYGCPRETSPHLDAFAARSIVFLDALSQFDTTHYSHQALFTGRYPFRHGIAPSLAQLLHAAGFRTAGFTGGGYLHRSFGFAEGFDEYVDEGPSRGFEALIPRAIEWLRRNRERPFFLFLHSYDIHCPYAPPEPYASLFREPGEPRLEFEGNCGSTYFNHLELTERDLADLSAAYDGGVRWVDAMLGELFAEFERLELERDTLVAIVSDHGEALGRDGFVGHGQLSEEELAVPLILRIPGEKPRRIDEPVALVDLFPTLLAQLGLEPTLPLDGVDLTPVVRGRFSFGGVRPRLSQSVYGKVAFRIDDTWKLVTSGSARDSELFDLRTDPHRNAIAEHPEVARRLMQRLNAVILEEPGGRPFGAARRTRLQEPDPRVREQLRALGYAE